MKRTVAAIMAAAVAASGTAVVADDGHSDERDEVSFVVKCDGRQREEQRLIVAGIDPAALEDRQPGLGWRGAPQPNVTSPITNSAAKHRFFAR
mmetsp:Transcript_33651/g.76889  ORF Transcript_33651/g.76889 Transcript_33651/m.76889 type:complete len:93 (-) Transcript_33651:1395-1673(-)